MQQHVTNEFCLSVAMVHYAASLPSAGRVPSKRPVQVNICSEMIHTALTPVTNSSKCRDLVHTGSVASFQGSFSQRFLHGAEIPLYFLHALYENAESVTLE